MWGISLDFPPRYFIIDFILLFVVDSKYRSAWTGICESCFCVSVPCFFVKFQVSFLYQEVPSSPHHFQHLGIAGGGLHRHRHVAPHQERVGRQEAVGVAAGGNDGGVGVGRSGGIVEVEADGHLAPLEAEAVRGDAQLLPLPVGQIGALRGVVVVGVAPSALQPLVEGGVGAPHLPAAIGGGHIVVAAPHERADT